MATTRKAIAAALLNLLAPPGGAFPTSGRRLVDPEGISGGQYPALFLIKPREKYSYDGEGETMPPTRALEFVAVVYFDYTANPAAVPADGIDDLLDTIDAAIAPTGADALNGNRQTLGGLVYHVAIHGEVQLAPGDFIGKGEIEIPIQVWPNSYP